MANASSILANSKEDKSSVSDGVLQVLQAFHVLFALHVLHALHVLFRAVVSAGRRHALDALDGVLRVTMSLG